MQAECLLRIVSLNNSYTGHRHRNLRELRLGRNRGAAPAPPALAPFPRGTAGGAAEALSHPLEKHFLLLWAQAVFEFQEEAGHLLFHIALAPGYSPDLGVHHRFIGLGLLQKLEKLPALLVQLPVQGSELLPVRRDPLAQKVLLVLVQLQGFQKSKKTLPWWRRHNLRRCCRRLVAEIYQSPYSPEIEGQGEDYQIEQPIPSHNPFPFSRS